MTLGVCIFITTSLVASHHKELPTDFPLPSDYNLDFQVASAQRAKLTITTVKGTDMNRVSDKVFQDLVGTTMINWLRPAVPLATVGD